METTAKTLLASLPLCCLLAAAHAQPAADSTAPAATRTWRLAERGPAHNLWIADDPGTNSPAATGGAGRVLQIESEINWLNPDTGQWEPSSTDFDLTPDGHAVSRRCDTKLIVSPNLAEPEGVLDVLGSDGVRVRSGVAGLNLYSPVTQRSLQVSIVQACQGVLTGPAEVTFPTAFEGLLKGSVRIRRERGQYHSDVILLNKLSRKQLAALGFGPNDRTRLEVWTRLFIAPEPVTTALAAPQPAGGLALSALTPPETADQAVIEFGGIRLIRGTAFLDGEPGGSIPIAKEIVSSGLDRYMVEAVEYSSLLPLLSSLPESAASEFKSKSARKTLLAGRLAPQPQTSPKGRSFQMARLDPARSIPGGPRLIWDYQALTGGHTNCTFQSGLTYWLSGTVNLYGTNTWEPACVLKFSRGAALNLVGGSIPLQVNWLGRPAAPVVLTAVDDNVTGESIGSTLSGCYANPAINIDAGAVTVTITNARIAYAQQAIASVGATLNLAHAQVLKGQCGLRIDSANATLRNVLFGNVLTNFNDLNQASVAVEHGTFSTSACLVSGTASSSLAVTNSILALVTNLNPSAATLTGRYNGFDNISQQFGSDKSTCSGSPFQSVGGGSFYLTDASGFRNVGVTNVAILNDLKERTTYPTIGFSNATFSIDTTFYPQAQRDADGQPDLGYHYDPLDYAFGGCTANANLTFARGTAAAWFRTSSGWQHAGHGIHLADQKTAVFDGRADAPTWWLRYNTVQEAVNGVWAGGYGPGGITGWAGSRPLAPEVQARFLFGTVLGGEGGSGNFFRDDYGYLVVRLQDCEFVGGGLGGYNTAHYHTNCLYEATSIWLEGGQATNAYILRNGTARGGNLNIHRWYQGTLVSVRDCAFDHTNFLTADAWATNGSPVTDYAYNAYVTNAPTLNPPGNTNVFVSTNGFGWETGALGRYYLPTNSPLIDAGSVSAAAAGCFHLTVKTNNIKDGLEDPPGTVDIGHHYVAVGADGKPLDYSSDGIPDYLHDRNGNGTVDSGETDWRSYTSPNGLTGATGLLLFTPVQNPR